MLMFVYLVVGILASLGVVFGFWLNSRTRADRGLRKRFFREVLGSPASDGIPAHLSLFQRLDDQDLALKEVCLRLRNAGLLNGRGEHLVATVEGVRDDLAAFIKERREAEIAWRAALQAQDIKVPSP